MAIIGVVGIGAAGLLWLAQRQNPSRTWGGRGTPAKKRTARVPTSRIDKVHFAVSSPPAVQPGQTIIVDVWAHLERQRAEVARRVERASPLSGSPPIIRSKGPFKIERGTTLFVRLRFPEFHVGSPEDAILWEGEIANASFEVVVPRQIVEGMKNGSVTVHSEGGTPDCGSYVTDHGRRQKCFNRTNNSTAASLSQSVRFVRQPGPGRSIGSNSGNAEGSARPRRVP